MAEPKKKKTVKKKTEDTEQPAGVTINDLSTSMLASALQQYLDALGVKVTTRIDDHQVKGKRYITVLIKEA